MDKIKDLNKYIKGQIDIEILDEKGEVVSKTTDYNNLTDRAIWFLILNCLLKNSLDGNRVINTNHNIFSNLLLVNTNQNSRSSDYIDGDIVGFCNLSELRSSNNPKEGFLIQNTAFKKGAYNFSVEFPLNRAMGTFNTIMLNSRDALDNRDLEVLENGYFGLPHTLEGIKGGIEDGLLVGVKTLFYVLNNGYYSIYNLNRDNNGELFFNFIKTESYNTNNLTPNTACYNPQNNKLYIQSEKTTLVYNADTMELLDTKTDAFKDTIAFYNGNIVGKHTESYYYGELASTLVIRDSENLNLIEEIVLENSREYIDTINNTFDGGFLYVTFKQINTSGTNLQVFASGINKIIDNLIPDYTFVFGTPTPNFDKNVTVNFDRNDGYRLSKCFLEPSTISKLVAPITKTSNQTLRVGYTFYINY